MWPPEDYAGLARVRAATARRSRSARTSPRSTGSGRSCAHRAADILQPSITKVGGISEMRKIAALAQAADLPVAPHAFYFGPGLAATFHVAATFGGAMPVEFPTGEHETPFLARPIAARDGWVEVPTGPGLGVEVNEEAVRRHPYSPAGATPFVLRRRRRPGFTDRELMVIAAGREIRDGEVVFVGMRLPLLAFAFAKRTHAPAAVGLFENGIVRDSPRPGRS